MVSKLAVAFVKQFPVLYAGLRSAYAQRVISRPPVQTPLGFKMSGIPSMEAGEFERDETQQVCALLGKGTVFVNVGANTGYYVCLARKAGARVVAIDPLDQSVQLLQRNVLVNGWTDMNIL